MIVAVRSALASPGRWLALLFLAIATPTGLLLVALTPLGQVPDEIAHAIRADSVRHGQFVARRMPTPEADGATRIGAGFDADYGIYDVMDSTVAATLAKAARVARGEAHWHGSLGWIDLTPLAIYAPVFYLPAALAIGVAARLHAEPAGALLAARYVNLGLFLLLGAAALLLARRGQGLMFCVLGLPMTLSLAASLNQDGLLIGTACLGIALLTRGGGARDPARLAAMALLALIPMVKPPYGVLALLLLLPLRRDWRSWAGGIAAVAVVLLPGALWSVYNQAFVAEPMPYAPQPAGPLWPGTPGEMFRASIPTVQARVLFADPWRLLTLPWDTLRQDVWLVRQTIGVLGWLSVVLPAWYYTLWLYAGAAGLLADALRQDRQALALRWMDRALLLLGALVALWVIFDAQYLLWTHIGHPLVEGVQGRYLLPLLPLAGLAVSGLVAAPRAGRALLLVLPVIALGMGLLVLPPALVQGFWVLH